MFGILLMGKKEVLMVSLGLDYGQRRVGVAKSDELNMFAHGLGYIDNTSDTDVCAAVKKYCDEYAVGTVLVGLPKQMDGELGIAAEKVLAFVELLRSVIAAEIITWDERLTSKEADRYLSLGKKKGKSSGKKKRQKVDQVAAQIMLQAYLDGMRNQLAF